MFQDTFLIDRFLFFTCLPPLFLWEAGSGVKGVGMEKGRSGGAGGESGGGQGKLVHWF